jgi:transcriptional regulator with XRE-family HTH domain
MLTLGQKIKAIRKEKGLTQAELVEDRITRNQLSLIENGINNPSISTLKFIAQRLNVPMSYFLSNDDFSMHKCQRLVTKAESLLDAGDNDKAITEIESFLGSLNGVEDNTLSDLLGRVYTLLGIAHYDNDKPRSRQVLLEAIKYLEQTDHKLYLSKAYNYIGIIYDDEGNLEQAENYLTKAYTLMLNANLENAILKLNIAYNLAYIYLKQEKYAVLIDFVNDNLKYSKKYKIFHNFGEFNMVLSAAYRYTFNNKQAILCTLKAIEYFQFSDDEVNKYTCYINLGIFYRLSVDYENSIKYLDMAKKYFEYTEKTTKALNANAEIVKTLFLVDNKGDSFNKLLNDVLSELGENNDNKPDLLSIKGTCLLENNDVDGATKLLAEAEASAKKPERLEFIAYAYLGLSKICKHNNQWENAYKYLDKANALPNKATKNIKFE